MNIWLIIILILIGIAIVYHRDLGILTYDYSKLKFWGKKKVEEPHSDSHTSHDPHASHGSHDNGIWNFLIVVCVVIFAVWFIRTKPWEPSGKDYTVYATPNDWSEKLMLADNGNYYKIVCHFDPGEEIIIEYTRRESDGQLYSYTQRYAYGQKFDLPPSLYYRVMSANGKSFDVTYTKTVWRT